jgi:O-antigen/teichoic acid export membrane protein
MSSTPRQITNASLYLLPIVVGNLIPILTLPIFTRLLSAEDFGAWALANAYAAVVGGLASVGLPITYDRNFFEYREGRQPARLLYSVIGFSLISFSLCAAATWVLRTPITRWIIGDAVYQNVLVWSLCSTAIVGIKAYYLAYLKNTEQAAAFSAYTIAERLLAAVLTVGLVAGARTGIMGLVIGQLVASTLVLAVMAARFLRTCPPGFDRMLLADSLKLGAPLTPRILLGVIGNNFDKYLIGQVASLGGVGIYSIGQRIANIAFTYMTALQNVFGPQVYTRMFSGAPDAGASIGRYLTPFAYISTLLAFIVAIFSEEILRVLAPATFLGAIPIVTILVLYYAIQFFGKMPQMAYARKTYLISLLAALSTGVNVALGAAGIWLWGTVGAAWGILAAGLVMSTITFVVGQRCFRIEWETGPLAAMFGLLFGSALLILGLRAAHTPYVVLSLVKLAALAGFLRLGGSLGIITRENVGVIRDLVSGRLRRAGLVRSES